MDLGKRLYNFGRKELQHRIGGDDNDRRDVGPADILISFVIARLALQIPSVLINLSLIPFLPVANIGFRLAAQAVLLAVKIAFDIVIVVYVAKIWGAKKKKEKEEDAAAYEAALAADQATDYLVPPPQPYYQTRSSANYSPYDSNYDQSSASSLWMHRGRKLGNAPVAAVQGTPSAVQNA
jgi:hypothetical protein